MMDAVKRIFAAGTLLAALWIAAGVPLAWGDEPVVNINTASAAELGGLKGIGDAKAKGIVEYREKKGPFKSVDDLRQVHGIGDKLLEQLRSHVTVGTVAASAPVAPAAAAAAKH
jgi:competence protein ComEA